MFPYFLIYFFTSPLSVISNLDLIFSVTSFEVCMVKVASKMSSTEVAVIVHGSCVIGKMDSTVVSVWFVGGGSAI